MTLSVFYSWQSDLANNLNRGLIRNALDEAVRAMNAELEVEESIRVDQDTQGVSGSPPIVDTILRKIDDCSVFVPDVSFVIGTDEGRKFPNPNVMIEYGYALKACGDEKIFPVFNTAFGAWEDLPFDMRHKRRPILYHASPEQDADGRRLAKKKLVNELESAFRTGSDNGLFGAPLPRITTYEPHVAKDGYGGSFLAPDEALGLTNPHSLPGETVDLTLRDGALIYMRLWQVSPISKDLTNAEVYEMVRGSQLSPMCGDRFGGWSFGRNRHGAFSFYAFDDDNTEAVGVTQLFKSGEIWGIDTDYLNLPERKETIGHTKYIPTGAVETRLKKTLAVYLQFARDSINLRPPLELRVGMTQTEGYELVVDTRWFVDRFAGRIFEPSFEHVSTIESYDLPAEEILMPFFHQIYDMAGQVRPESQK